MPTSKASSSPARIAANRANAQKSTGPKTAEGRARSRANAVKHGLTGAGIALPGEDDAAVRALCAEIQEEWAPAGRTGAELAHDVALLTIRKRRAREAQAAWLRSRVRRAEAEFDKMRAGHADRLLDAIEAHPRSYRRELLAMPEGVDRLVAALEELVDDLLGAAPLWSQAHHARLDALFGYRPADLPRSRPTRFSRAVLGDFAAIGADEVAAIPEGHSPHAWAGGRLVEAIDAEIDRLQAHRLTLDHAGIAQDRADAAVGARFDTSREAELARRYELAAARELSRTLRDFPRAEALDGTEPPAAAGTAPAATGPAESVPDADPHPKADQELAASLGSFGASPAAAPDPAPIAVTEAPVVPGAPRRPVPTVAFTPPRTPPGR